MPKTKRKPKHAPKQVWRCLSAAATFGGATMLPGLFQQGGATPQSFYAGDYFIRDTAPQGTTYSGDHTVTFCVDLARDSRLQESIERMCAETATAGWDDEGGVPISPKHWKLALRIYQAARVAGFSAPHIAPCGDGSIHFAWGVSQKARLTLEVHPTVAQWSVLTSDGNAIRGRAPSWGVALRRLRNERALIT